MSKKDIKYRVYDGSTSLEARTEILSEFEDIDTISQGDIEAPRVLLIQIKAGSVGLNLQKFTEIYGKLLLFGGVSGLISTSILILVGQKLNQYVFYFGFGIISSLSLIIMGSDYGIANIFIIFAMISFAKGFFNTMGTTIIQSNVKEEFRGRVMSISQLSWGSVAIGAIIVGYLAESYSISFSFRFIGYSSLLVIVSGGAITLYKLLKKD